MAITENIFYLKHTILSRLNANGGINILDYMKEALTKNYSNYGFTPYREPIGIIEAQIDNNTIHFVMLTFYLGSGSENDERFATFQDQTCGFLYSSNVSDRSSSNLESYTR
jgi:hypothetical protein